MVNSVNETEFLVKSQAVLDSLERQFDGWQDVLDVDIELERSDNVLTICIIDTVYIIVNSQLAMQEIWVAAPSGGFHYRFKDGQWQDTRGGQPLAAALSEIFSQVCGQAITVTL